MLEQYFSLNRMLVKGQNVPEEYLQTSPRRPTQSRLARDWRRVPIHRGVPLSPSPLAMHSAS